MKVLVTGAGGFLGSHVVDRLLAEGDSVRALVRPTNVPDDLAARGVEVVVGDVTDASSRREACRGCEAVIHAASLVTEVAVPDDEYRRVNVDGTAALARDAAAAGVRRFVHVGSTSVYAPNPLRPIDERTPFAPEDVYGRSKAAGEIRLREVEVATGLPVVIVRPSRIYGPRDASLIRVFRAIDRRRFLRVGPCDAVVDFVHATDVAAALAAARLRGSGDYVFGGPERVTLREFFDAVARSLGRTLPAVSIPLAPAMLVARLVAAAWTAAGREPPIAPKRFAFFRNGRVVDGNRAATDLGVYPRVRLRDGLAATARWYRDAGWLGPSSGAGTLDGAGR